MSELKTVFQNGRRVVVSLTVTDISIEFPDPEPPPVNQYVVSAEVSFSASLSFNAQALQMDVVAGAGTLPASVSFAVQALQIGAVAGAGTLSASGSFAAQAFVAYSAEQNVTFTYALARFYHHASEIGWTPSYGQAYYNYHNVWITKDGDYIQQGAGNHGKDAPNNVERWVPGSSSIIEDIDWKQTWWAGVNPHTGEELGPAGEVRRTFPLEQARYMRTDIKTPTDIRGNTQHEPQFNKVGDGSDSEYSFTSVDVYSPGPPPGRQGLEPPPSGSIPTATPRGSFFTNALGYIPCGQFGGVQDHLGPWPTGSNTSWGPGGWNSSFIWHNFKSGRNAYVGTYDNKLPIYRARTHEFWSIPFGIFDCTTKQWIYGDRYPFSESTYVDGWPTYIKPIKNGVLDDSVRNTFAQWFNPAVCVVEKLDIVVLLGGSTGGGSQGNRTVGIIRPNPNFPTEPEPYIAQTFENYLPGTGAVPATSMRTLYNHRNCRVVKDTFAYVGGGLYQASSPYAAASTGDTWNQEMYLLDLNPCKDGLAPVLIKKWVDLIPPIEYGNTSTNSGGAWDHWMYDEAHNAIIRPGEFLWSFDLDTEILADISPRVANPQLTGAVTEGVVHDWFGGWSMAHGEYSRKSEMTIFRGGRWAEGGSTDTNHSPRISRRGIFNRVGGDDNTSAQRSGLVICTLALPTATKKSRWRTAAMSTSKNAFGTGTDKHIWTFWNDATQRIYAFGGDHSGGTWYAGPKNATTGSGTGAGYGTHPHFPSLPNNPEWTKQYVMPDGFIFAGYGTGVPNTFNLGTGRNDWYSIDPNAAGPLEARLEQTFFAKNIGTPNSLTTATGAIPEQRPGMIDMQPQWIDSRGKIWTTTTWYYRDRTPQPGVDTWNPWCHGVPNWIQDHSTNPTIMSGGVWSWSPDTVVGRGLGTFVLETSNTLANDASNLHCVGGQPVTQGAIVAPGGASGGQILWHPYQLDPYVSTGAYDPGTDKYYMIGNNHLFSFDCNPSSPNYKTWGWYSAGAPTGVSWTWNYWLQSLSQMDVCNGRLYWLCASYRTVSGKPIWKTYLRSCNLVQLNTTRNVNSSTPRWEELPISIQGNFGFEHRGDSGSLALSAVGVKALGNRIAIIRSYASLWEEWEAERYSYQEANGPTKTLIFYGDARKRLRLGMDIRILQINSQPSIKGTIASVNYDAGSGRTSVAINQTNSGEATFITQAFGTTNTTVIYLKTNIPHTSIAVYDTDLQKFIPTQDPISTSGPNAGNTMFGKCWGANKVTGELMLFSPGENVPEYYRNNWDYVHFYKVT